VPDLDVVVAAVCRLPLDFHSIHTMSGVDLVRRSGYLSVRSDVTVERLSQCLREHPDWVNQWFAWSDDTRGSPAWRVFEKRSGQFHLSYYDEPGSPPPMVFTDKVQACAEYVHREIEEIADLSEHIAAHGDLETYLRASKKGKL
jgi:hypothetical protein